jgi:hypothetical protein
MFKLVTQSGSHYTGRACQYWVSSEAPAWLYSLREAAQAKADQFNSYSGLHGFTFTVVEVK